MSGRITVAPCGHTGETIVGTYVKCLMGCEGPAVISKRAEPGHILNCTCAPCKIRRLTVKIVLRDVQGKDWATHDWDGTRDVIAGETTKYGAIKHFVFLDTDGKVVARGNTQAYLNPGGYKIRINHILKSLNGLIVDAIKNDVKVYDPNQVTIVFNGKVIGVVPKGWIP